MLLEKARFICLDCEFTGLDLEQDRILEVAAIRFTLEKNLEEFETLCDPETPISEESIAIHHITPEMVKGKPKVGEILPTLLEFIGKDCVVGHGIGLDLEMLDKAAKRAHIPSNLSFQPTLDTLRLARLYGDSPNNSLGTLAAHFNASNPGAHRAKNDVEMNIEVFKHLIKRFKTVEQVRGALSKPIKMRFMPLGKHKGRPFSEIPLAYLQWAARMDFDQDLLFSIRLEIKKRKKGGGFSHATNPFAEL
ncbi:MAG: DNA polymerase III PolC-type [Chlamydiae bacterium]|nr:DNA polymerase III PolC-type [Chlamydiota bacterium]